MWEALSFLLRKLPLSVNDALLRTQGFPTNTYSTADPRMIQQLEKQRYRNNEDSIKVVFNLYKVD
jgi:hypothetical protein